MEKQIGFKPIPISLKILAAVFILWIIGSLFNLPNLYENGLPFFGIFISGINAGLIVLYFDIIGPVVFLYMLWNRKSWGVIWAFSYIGLFILNGFVALFTLRDQIVLPQILVPIIISFIFLIVIFLNRKYFK